MASKQDDIELLTARFRRVAARLPADTVRKLTADPAAFDSAVVKVITRRASVRLPAGSRSSRGASSAELARGPVRLRQAIRRPEPITVVSATSASDEASPVIGSAPGDYLSGDQAAGLRARLVEPVEVDDTLSSDEAARTLGLAKRQSIHERHRRGELIGFEAERRGVRFPRAQFDDERRVLPGVAELLTLFGDAHGTWHWLTTSTNLLDDRTPLEGLRRGDAAAVLGAARAHLQGDFG